MPIKKLREKYRNRRKLTYKELEWDYLPIIVLFAVVSGILTLLLILLAIFEGVVIEERNLQFDLKKANQNIRNYFENNEPTPTPEVILDDFDL